MATITIFVSDTSRTSNEAKQIMQLSDAAKNNDEAVLLSRYFRRLAGGLGNGNVRVSVSGTAGVQAAGTITFASLANNDTITVAGVTMTAKTSGASGNAQFNLGANDTAAAANAVVLINAHPTASLYVIATSALGVVTIRSLRHGILGNFIPLASSNNTRAAVSGATLAAGAGYDGVDIRYAF